MTLGRRPLRDIFLSNHPSSPRKPLRGKTPPKKPANKNEPPSAKNPVPAKHEANKASRRAAPKKPQRVLTLGRLPHGSDFSLSYDADRQLWTGSLRVGQHKPDQVFTAEESGVFRLLSALDRQYRAWAFPSGTEQNFPLVEETERGVK